MDQGKTGSDMRHPESILQRACVRWFKMQYPNELIYANANGGYRSKIEAAIMKGEGVLSGVPDLFIAKPNRINAGLYIEMKAENGRLTENQKIISETLLTKGYEVKVVRNIDEFIKIVNNYLAI